MTDGYDVCGVVTDGGEGFGVVTYDGPNDPKTTPDDYLKTTNTEAG